MIVIGLGAGRTGTASLSDLFNSQKDAICFHELNPTCAAFEGNPQSILNTIAEFRKILDGGDKRRLALDYSRRVSVEKYAELQAMNTPRLIGDIAYYYLMYVGDILSIDRDTKFVCIKRDKKQTVDSWMSKSQIPRWRSLRIADRLKAIITRTPYHESYNFWQEHDGTEYAFNPVWDSTFPKFKAESKRDAIEKYWDFYYEQAAKTAAEYPDNFRIFDIRDMSHTEGIVRILSFVGVPKSDMVLKDEFHLHKLNTA